MSDISIKATLRIAYLIRLFRPDVDPWWSWYYVTVKWRHLLLVLAIRETSVGVKSFRQREDNEKISSLRSID